jgi:hypothetical protein
MPPSSPLGDLFRQLDNLRIKVDAIKRAPVRGNLRAEALETHAAELKETWESLCEETGLSKDEILYATDVLAGSPLRFLADARWHATPCIQRTVCGTRPSWDWPARTRSTPGKTMATIKLRGRRYLLHTYCRSKDMPKTLQWAGTTEPKWVAGKEEQPGKPIVLEHKLSVPERESYLIPYTPHKMHDQDLLVRFSGTQELMIREVGDQHDRITFDGKTQPEYSFLDAKYLTQFHQDLRGRKAVACVDVDNISSSASVAHSPKLYLWRDTQNFDMHFHTISYYSQAEGKELEFPLLWLHGTCTKQKLLSKSLLFHFRFDAERDGEKRAIKRHSGLSLLPSSGTYTHSNCTDSPHDWSGNISQTKDVGHLYVPLGYNALLAEYKFLTVNFESVSGKLEFYFFFKTADV